MKEYGVPREALGPVLNLSPNSPGKCLFYPGSHARVGAQVRPSVDPRDAQVGGLRGREWKSGEELTPGWETEDQG
jgi:hypothetical protein